MKKKDIFLIALFLTIQCHQNAFAVGTLSSYISEYKSINTNQCSYTNGCTACQTYMSFTLNWNKSNAVNGQWTNYVYAHTAVSGWTIVGSASNYSGNYLIGTWQGSYCPSTVTQIEQSVNSAGWQVSEYFIPTGGSQITLNSNLAQISNPVAAPETDLLSTNQILTTPDPINIATGESYFSSKDFSLSGRGPKLELFRKYASFSTLNGLFGYGWRTDFDINLTI